MRCVLDAAFGVLKIQIDFGIINLQFRFGDSNGRKADCLILFQATVRHVHILCVRFACWLFAFEKHRQTQSIDRYARVYLKV